MNRLQKACRDALCLPIRLYKRFLSPALGRNCRFTPTCSEYAMEAIQTHGSPDFLPGEMEGQTFPPRDGYCERQMILTVTIPNTFNLRHAPWR